MIREILSKPVLIAILDIDKQSSAIMKKRLSSTEAKKNKKHKGSSHLLMQGELEIFHFNVLLGKKAKDGSITRFKEWIDVLSTLVTEIEELDLLKAFKGLLDRSLKTSLHHFAGNFKLIGCFNMSLHQ